MLDLLTRIRHAIKADPRSPRIEAVRTSLESVLCTLLASEPSSLAPAPQCPVCGSDMPPTVDEISGQIEDDKYRCRCTAGCGNFTTWCPSEGEALEVFYKKGQ